MKTLIFDLDGTLVRLKPTLVCFADMQQLTLLRSQYNFALVSGSVRGEVEWALTETGLRPLFDDLYVVTFDDTKSEKSSGRSFKEIQKRLQGEMVMIGDSLSDEAGSALAGIPFVKVKSTRTVSSQKKSLRRGIKKALGLFKVAKT